MSRKLKIAAVLIFTVVMVWFVYVPLYQSQSGLAVFFGCIITIIHITMSYIYISNRTYPYPSPTGVIIEMWRHYMWGDNIVWSEFDRRRIYGFCSYPIVPGDEIRAKAESGRIMRFLVAEINWEDNPNDMFFATLVDLDYLEEDDESKENIHLRRMLKNKILV